MVKRVVYILRFIVNLTLSIYLFGLLYADDIEYNFEISNKKPYKNEAIVLDVNISQIDQSKVMFFKFTPKKSKDYEFYQIGFKEDEKYHDLKQHYRYLIYPKREGRVLLEFELIKSITDDDKVAYAISGDRDNVKSLEKKDITIPIEPLVLDVKALPKDTDIVGDYKLSYRVDKTTTDAYEPIHLDIELQGRGKLDTFPLIPESKSYHLFTQKPTLNTYHTPTDIKSVMKWEYAILSKESFILPKIVLHAFNPKREESYNLILPNQKIEVRAIAKENLVDREDTPPPMKPLDWSWIGWLLSYITVFIAGYLMPKDIFKRDIAKKSKDREFKEKIARVKSHKELLQILLLDDRVKYQESIEDLESVIYGDSKIPLKKIKKELMCKEK